MGGLRDAPGGHARGDIGGGEPHRRHYPRFAVWGRHAWLHWREGDGGGGASVELVNISAGGAMTVSPSRPRPGQVVGLGVEDIAPPSRLVATAVAVHSGDLGHQVHLEFLRPCPPELIGAVLDGRDWAVPGPISPAG